jgi:hypothetical protein
LTAIRIGTVVLLGCLLILVSRSHTVYG